MPQPDDQDAKVRDSAKLSEAPVRGDKNAALLHCEGPKVRILQRLLGRPANVPHVVADFPQTDDGHPWDVLVNQDSHPLIAAGREGGDLLFGQVGGVVEGREDIFTCERRVLEQ